MDGYYDKLKVFHKLLKMVQSKDYKCEKYAQARSGYARMVIRGLLNETGKQDCIFSDSYFLILLAQKVLKDNLYVDVDRIKDIAKRIQENSK